MQPISNNKFFTRYLPLTISVVLLVATGFLYLVLRPQTKSAEAGWYSTGGTWNYRKSITINHNQVASSTGETYANFPVLINLTSDSGLAAYASSTGADILFTLGDGTTKLNHEIESYSSSTGALIAWVNVGSGGLSTTTDTTLYMYYGNASSSSQQNATSTWDSNYMGVYHLGKNGSLSLSDSTSNGYTLTNHNSAVATTSPFGTGAYLNHTGSQYFENTSFSMSGTPDYTFSYWEDTPTSTVQQSAFGFVNCAGYSGCRFQAHSPYSDDYIYWDAGFYDVPGRISISYPALNVWDYITLVKKGDNTYQAIYKNGTLSPAHQTTGATSTSVSDLTIGEWGNNYYMLASLAEFRVSKTVRSADWIKTEYNNQSSPGTFYSIGTGAPRPLPPAVALNSRSGSVLAWYTTGGTWQFRRRISIPPTAVKDPNGLANFPMLIRETNNDFKYTSYGGKKQATDGSDFLFTDSSGNKIPYEIEKYASTTGESELWVQVPFVSPISTTAIYMYYGGTSGQSNATGTWDSNYKGVWHLNTTTGATSTDSTVNGNNATAYGSPVATSTGPIGHAMLFNGSNYFENASPPNLPTSFPVTLEGWVYLPPTGAFEYPLQITPFEGTGSSSWVVHIAYDGGKMYYYANGVEEESATVPNNVWNHFVYVYSSSTSISFYMNGTSYSIPQPSGWTWGASHLTIGCDAGGAGYCVNSGTMEEELRVSNSARSAGWIGSEYLNQSSPDQFYALGGAEVQSGRLTPAGAANAPAVKLRGGGGSTSVITRVNQAGNYSSSGQTGINAVLNNAIAGHLIVVGVCRWSSPIGTAPAVNQFSGTNVGAFHLVLTDTEGNSYSALLWTTVTANGNATVNWTFPNSETPYATIGLGEYSGANTSNPVDSTAHSHSPASANASTTPVSVGAGELLVAFVGGDGAVYTRPGGYGSVYNQPNTSGDMPADMADYLPTAGSYNTQWTNVSDDWTAVGASFKPASSGGGGSVKFR